MVEVADVNFTPGLTFSLALLGLQLQLQLGSQQQILTLLPHGMAALLNPTLS